MRILRQGFEQAGYMVTVAGDGEAVLRYLREATPDVLVVDGNITPMSGEELCRRIQADFPDRRFLVCVLTDSAEDEYANYAQWFTNFRMLEKPISLRRLMSHVERHTAAALA